MKKIKLIRICSRRSEGRYEQGTWIKGGSPDLGLGEGEGAKHHCTASKQGKQHFSISNRRNKW